MKRACIVAIAVFGFLTSVCSADAQPTGEAARIAVVAPFSTAGLNVFRDALRDAGYVEGRNLSIDYRFEARSDRLAALAAELVALNPRLLIGVGSPPVTALMGATKTIPILMFGVTDPVGNGFVTNLARPEANVTGLTGGDEVLGSKRLELLMDLRPGLSRVAIWRNPAAPTHLAHAAVIQEAARARGIVATPIDHFGPGHFEEAFQEMARQRAEAVIMLADNAASPYKEEIVALAARYRLPTIYSASEWADSGALMTYTADFDDRWRRAAIFVDKILKGAKPADLPVEDPTKFKLVINLKAAKAIGLTVPLSLLNRTDEVIE